MRSKHLTNTNNPQEDDDSQATWLNWCRLCAKRELNEEECCSIFANKGEGKTGNDLATSVGKYFWVNMKAEDEISQCLCWECEQLLEELVAFTERINKVQTLYCLLQNIKPTTAEEALKFRSQYGLKDEDWRHIIRPEPEAQVPQSAKPLLLDQQVQTDMIAPPKIETVRRNKDKTGMETVQKPQRNEADEEYDSQAEIEAETGADTDAAPEHVYEYVMNVGNEVEYEENDEVIIPTNSVENEVNEEEEEVLDSDLFKEFKYKYEEDDKEKSAKRFKIISEQEEVDVEYQHNSHLPKSDEVMEDSVEMLEEEDEEAKIDNEMYAKKSRINAFEVLKRKRGREKLDNVHTVYTYECKECKRKYKNPNIFRKHMLSLHNIVVDTPEHLPSNICSVCKKEFLTQSSLKLHMRLHLPDEEKFNIPCPYCERKFTQVGAMKQHVNGIHHQMKPFICDQCGRACKTMAALTEHQLVHTTECPFECEVCHKRFKNKPRLKSHLDTHNKSVYKCPDCNLELNTKRTLLQHRLVHSDEKRFKCEFCDAAFKRSKALKNHLILHTGLRPYKCNFCSKSFSNGSNCRAHKKRTHPLELAEEEANGKTPEHVNIPKLEELKSAKSMLMQPRKIKRSNNTDRTHVHRMLHMLHPGEQGNMSNSQDYEHEDEEEDDDGTGGNYNPDFHYEIVKSEIDETESLIDNPSEECEETVIYEIIDEI